MTMRQSSAVTRFVAPAALFVLAFLVRLVPLLNGGGLYPTDNYDPSVYYAAAVGLNEGRLPYRDFLLLHPPGLLLFLQPFAALGALIGDPGANAAAHVTFMLMGAVSTVIIFRLLAPRGLLAASLGAGFYLVYFPAIYSERTTRLEGLASLLILLGLVALGPQMMKASVGWRAVLAGALFGLGATVKIWGVVLVAALCLWLLLSQGLKMALLAAAGALAAAVIVIGPFAVLAPQFWSMVVLDQVGRPRLLVGPVERLNDILGLGQFGPATLPLWITVTLLAVVACCLAAALRTGAGRLFGLLLVVALVTLLTAPSWFTHYGVLSAAPLALVLGVGVAEIAAKLPAWGRGLATVLVALLIAAGAVAQLEQVEGSPFPGAEVAAVLSSRPGCVTTDNPTSLILSDTLRRNLRRGCPLMVDLSGYMYQITRTDGSDPYRNANPEFQRELMRYLSSGDTTVIMRLWPDSFSAQNQAAVRKWPVLGRFNGHSIRAPRVGG
jgi:alpha-1,2-mannosyltransferase